VGPILDLALTLNYRKRLPAIYTAITSIISWLKEDTHKGLNILIKSKIAEEFTDYLSWGCALPSVGLLAQCSQFTDAHKHENNVLDFSLWQRIQWG